MWCKGVIILGMLITALITVRAQDDTFAIITPENADELKIIQTLELTDTYANQIAFNPADSPQLAVAQKDSVLSIWNIETGTRVQNWTEAYIVKDVAYSKDGQRLMTATNECVNVRETITGTVLSSICLDGSPNPADAFLLAPISTRSVMVAYEDGRVLLWNTETQNLIVPIYGPSARPIQFSVSQDEQWMALSTQAGFYLYQLESIEKQKIYLREFLKMPIIVEAAFFPRMTDFQYDMDVHGSGLVTMGYEAQPSLWGIDEYGNYSPELSLPLETNLFLIEKFVFNTDGRLLAVAGYDDYLDPIDAFVDDANLSCLVNDVNLCHISVFSIDITESETGNKGEFYNSTSHEIVSTNIVNLGVVFNKHFSAGDPSASDRIFSDLIFSPDNRFLATSTYDGHILIWGIPQP
jgi:WD40 repeat protein